VKILDMTVEDGLKLVISMGLVFPERPHDAATEAKLAEAAVSKKTRGFN
jgi:uncharacterized membrane protein